MQITEICVADFTVHLYLDEDGSGPYVTSMSCGYGPKFLPAISMELGPLSVEVPTRVPENGSLEPSKRRAAVCKIGGG